MHFISTPLAAAAAFIGIQTAAATVRIEVDLGAQSMHVASAHGEYDWAVSTGRPGYRTPTGAYRPQRMFEMTYSRKYDNAPMPHAIFFTGGYAIHGSYATRELGQVASHGCIRLAPGHAAALYKMVQREGASIVIAGSAPDGDDNPAPAPPRRARGLAARRDRETSIADGLRHYRLAPGPRWSADNPLENQ